MGKHCIASAGFVLVGIRLIRFILSVLGMNFVLTSALIPAFSPLLGRRGTGFCCGGNRLLTLAGSSRQFKIQKSGIGETLAAGIFTHNE